MITKKNVQKLQNEAIKVNASNLVGACKLYAAVFNDCKDLKDLCKRLEIPVEYAIKVSAIAKDKKTLVAICGQMLPKVGDTFVRMQLYSKVYNDSKADAEKGTPNKPADWCAENVVYGGGYKPFGFASAERLETENSAKWITKETDEYKAMYVATTIRNYSIRLVAKCVAEYLSHESQQ